MEGLCGFGVGGPELGAWTPTTEGVELVPYAGEAYSLLAVESGGRVGLSPGDESSVLWRRNDCLP